MSTDIQKMLQEHHNLFEGTAAKVGKLHHHILKSEHLLEIKKEENTNFRDEIGCDEIHWWVFYKEKNLAELKDRTEKVLKSFQKVKEDSVKLRQTLQVKNYGELINNIKKFCTDHEFEIQHLLDYVQWLETKDPLAVTMLFNYRVWGSTRMGNRTIPVPQDIEIETKKCVEIALGLRNSFHSPTIHRMFMDVNYEIYEKMCPEEYYTTNIETPWDQIIFRTSNEVLTEMVEYFEFLRNSLRNIQLEIREYETSDHILQDSNFWKSFVKKIMTLSIENMQWDFKETLPMWKSTGTTKKKKKIDFCEDVASFANMNGGVLIIGVSDKMPRKIVGLEDLENKMKYVKDVIQKGIDYPRNLTHFQVLTFDDKENKGKMCLLIIIKCAISAVGVNIEKSIKSKIMNGIITTPVYPIRQETGITRVSRMNVDNSKMHLKHDSYKFIASLKTNYSGTK